jgi:hypothetical protein
MLAILLPTAALWLVAILGVRDSWQAIAVTVTAAGGGALAVVWLLAPLYLAEASGPAPAFIGRLPQILRTIGAIIGVLAYLLLPLLLIELAAASLPMVRVGRYLLENHAGL